MIKSKIRTIGIALIFFSLVLNKFVLSFLFNSIFRPAIDIFESTTINILVVIFEVILFLFGFIILRFPEYIIKKRRLIGNLVLFLSTFLALFLLVELANYIFVVNSDGYYVWPPNLNVNSYPDPDITYGIDGISLFTINELGYRGPIIQNKNEEYRILIIGGSTAECLYLDNSEAWPRLLGNFLNTTRDGRRVISMNVGKSGLTLRDHILQLEHLSDQYKPDLVIMLLGANDLMLKLSLGDKWRPYLPDYSRSFYYSPHYSFKHTIFYKILSFLWGKFILKEKPHNINIYVESRLARANSEKIDVIPDHTDSLQYYFLNLNKVINISRKREVKLLLLTQPHLWDETISVAEENSLWFTGNLRGDFYSTRVMASLMDEYNNQLLEVCSKNQDILCFDLDSRIPRNLDNFYDDLHFNEGGAVLVAQQLAKFINESIWDFVSENDKKQLFFGRNLGLFES